MVCFLLGWRILGKVNVSRYYFYLVLPCILIITEAGRQLYFDLQKFFPRSNNCLFLFFTLCLICLICIGKVFHYNPYSDYYKKTCEFIQYDFQQNNYHIAYIFTKRPMIVKHILNEEKYIVLTLTYQSLDALKTNISELRFSQYPIYLLLDEKKQIDDCQQIFILEDPHAEFKLLKRFRKNRKSKNCLSVYKLTPSVTSDVYFAPKTFSTSSCSLLTNGNFEKYIPLKFSASRKKNFNDNNITSLHEGQPFPAEWSIEGTPGFWPNSTPNISLQKEIFPKATALKLESDSLITIYNKKFFTPGYYELSFYVIGKAQSFFSLAFREFGNEKFVHRRYCTFILPESNKTYYILLNIPSDYFLEQRFQICLELQKGLCYFSNIKLLSKPHPFSNTLQKK